MEVSEKVRLPQSDHAAEWAQYSYSIPPAVNPALDQSGEFCEVGQRGDTWFLNGTYGNGPVVRSCTIPAEKTLFFPLIVSTYFDTPDVCGQGASISIDEMRAGANGDMDAVTRADLWIDGVKVNKVARMRSPVFELAFPADNVINQFCGAGGLPRGVYTAVNEGYFGTIAGLEVGMHTVHFIATMANGFEIDATYQINVVPVVR
jgi:hypothetical protein